MRIRFSLELQAYYDRIFNLFYKSDQIEEVIEKRSLDWKNLCINGNTVKRS